MIPQSILFTGLEINPPDMMWKRVVEGPFPLDWERIVISDASSNKRQLIAWTLENIYGRFGIISSSPYVILYFEDANDAVLFKLKDGQDAWREGFS